MKNDLGIRLKCNDIFHTNPIDFCFEQIRFSGFFLLTLRNEKNYFYYFKIIIQDGFASENVGVPVLFSLSSLMLHPLNESLELNSSNPYSNVI